MYNLKELIYEKEKDYYFYRILDYINILENILRLFLLNNFCPCFLLLDLFGRFPLEMEYQPSLEKLF